MQKVSANIESEDMQGYFPIRTLSIKTGVNSVTLRAWERRYGLLKPKRTAKGHRLYSETDVARVEAIVRWIQQGVAVGKVRALLDKEDGFESLAPSNEWLELQTQLVDAAQQLNEDKIERLYQQTFSQYPPQIAISHWILPSLDQLGVSTHSRYCEAVLTRCLVNRLSSLRNQNTGSSVVLITGLLGQRDFQCYLAAAILGDHGFACRVLPNMTSEQDWLSLANQIKPATMLAFCESEQTSIASDLVKALANLERPVSLVGASFWLAAHDKNVTQQGGVTVFSDFLEGVEWLLNQTSSQ